MANEEQLKILLQGEAAWDKWRMENPDDYIDLSKAKLSGADLTGAYLYTAKPPAPATAQNNEEPIFGINISNQRIHLLK